MGILSSFFTVIAIFSLFTENHLEGAIRFDIDSIDRESWLYDRRLFFQWPSLDRIEADQKKPDPLLLEKTKKQNLFSMFNLDKVPIVKAYGAARHWLREILREKYIPQNVFDRLIALDGKDGEPDTIRIQYRIGDGDCFQITQTPSSVFLVFKPKDAFRYREDCEEGRNLQLKSFACEKIFSLFNEEDSIRKALSMIPIKEGKQSVFLGRNSRTYNSELRAANHVWWGKMRWWTDGKTFAFFIPKYLADSPVFIPFNTKEWF